MSEKRIVVWVQRFKDRDSLMLQWIDPHTGKRKSKSAGTNYLPLAEIKAKDLEYELNNNLHKEASRMRWRSSASCSRPNTWPRCAQTLNLPTKTR